MDAKNVLAGAGTRVSTAPRRIGWSKALVHALLILWAITTIFPFLWVINNSFKSSRSIMQNGFSIAIQPIWDNYINAFTRQQIGRGYLNSLIVSGSVTVLVMLLSSLLSFAMTRYRFRGRGLIHALIVGSLMFPAFSTIFPVFKMLASVGLIDKHLGAILPQTAGNLAFATVVMMGFIGQLPCELEEAAFMEGCSVYQIFLRIVVPLSKSALATVAIFSFLWSYNDLFLQMIVLRTRPVQPICALMREISSQFGTDFGLMAAAVSIIVIPVLTIYILLQKNIVKGLTAGAVKG